MLSNTFLGFQSQSFIQKTNLGGAKNNFFRFLEGNESNIQTHYIV